MTDVQTTGSRRDDAVLIQPRDPLVLRDARPFSAEPGARAFCLTWPFPRTVAGTLRTHIGNTARPPLDWSSRAGATRARGIVTHGPLLLGRTTPNGAWQVHVPAPRDVVFYRDPEAPAALRAMVLRPQVDLSGGGTNLPAASQSRTASNGYEKALANTDLRPIAVTRDVKPEVDVPAWWRLDDAVRWLTTPAAEPDSSRLPYVEPDATRPDAPQILYGMRALPLDTRVHVSIDPATQTNLNGALFTTESLVFPDTSASPTDRPAAAMLCRVQTDLDWDRDDALVPLGGEGRLARISTGHDSAHWPAVQYPAAEDFAESTGLRLLLVTPALFAHGWLPAWLADGTIPGLAGLRAAVHLVGASIDRRSAVSGWRLARRQVTPDRELAAGPRATRYAVPAGGVYFLRFANGAPDPTTWRQIWERLWLAPVSDRAVDRDEGFGLVLPGLWRDERETTQESPAFATT